MEPTVLYNCVFAVVSDLIPLFGRNPEALAPACGNAKRWRFWMQLQPEKSLSLEHCGCCCCGCCCGFQENIAITVLYDLRISSVTEALAVIKVVVLRS
jgi:hypothetical protein